MICDYGCGQEAKFQLNNGKMCCSENRQSCPEQRKKFITKSSQIYIECSKCGRKISKQKIEYHESRCMINFCLTCGKPIHHKQKFCSSKCSYEANVENLLKAKKEYHYSNKDTIKQNVFKDKNKIFNICLNCGKIINNNGTKFCSVKCQQEFIFNNTVSDWLSGNITGTCKSG